MRTCPRCGAQVKVHQDTCNCGFNWLSEHSAGLVRDLRVPGGLRPEHTIEQFKRAPLWPWVVGLVFIGLGGWHVYCSQRLEASIVEYINAQVGSPADTTIAIHVQPVTNLVSIDLKVVDKSAKALKPSDRLMLDAAVSSVRSSVEPYFERELTLVARKQVDLYAMAIPYRLAFSLDISPKRKYSRASELRHKP